MVNWLLRLFARDPEEGTLRDQLDRWAATEIVRHGPAHHQEPARGLTGKVVQRFQKRKAEVADIRRAR